MGEQTAISWADATFNPWHGCVEVSPACGLPLPGQEDEPHGTCYAKVRDANPYFNILGQTHWGKDAPRRFFGDKHWNNPIRWNRKAEKEKKRIRVFCGSMCDVMEQHGEASGPFHMTPTDEARDRLYRLIEDTPMLDWLLLTKRPQNYAKLLPETWLVNPRPNVWLGTTLETPAYMWRADELRKVDCAVRWLSMEPLLLEFTEVELARTLHRIDWAIFGGESGKDARTTRMAWIQAGIKVCLDRGTTPFMKQTGSNLAPADRRLFEISSGVKMKHKAGANPAEWPQRFRMQALPIPRRFTAA